MAQTHRVVSEYRLPENALSNIRVYVRARPLEDRTEPGDFISVGSTDQRQITIKDPDISNRKYSEVSFQFDKVFWTDVGQEEIFHSMCKPQVEHVLKGFNTCCFAYGQTGSGKTYSMFGGDDEIRGVIPRTAEYLFQALNKKSSTHETAVVSTFLEIYNDQVRDLGKAYLVSIGAVTSTSAAIFNKTSDIFESLAGKRGNPYFAPAFYNNGPSKMGSGVQTAARGLGYKEVQDEYRTMNYEIHEDGDGSVFVKNLSMVPVTTIDEVMSMINLGLKVRATHETKLNASSSRSHTVFTLSVLQRDKVSGVSVSGMLNLVDLAGSERLKKSESQGVRLKETLHINTSLSALGKVIMSLDPSAESTHIPYRDAKLTRILQNSLGGNSYTIVLAAIHPVTAYYDECLSTLQFANRCRNVRNNPRVNYVDDPVDKELRLKRLQEELFTLRTKVAHYEKNGVAVTSKETGTASMSAAKLILVLKKLGIAADVTPEGVLLINGERKDLGELGLEGEEEGSTHDGLEGVSDDAEGVVKSSYSVSKLRRICADLQEANRVHSLKSKDRNTLMQEQNKQIQDLTKHVAKLQATIRRGEHDLLTQKESYEVRSVEERKAALELQRAEMDKVASHNESVLKKHTDIMQSAPSAFKTYSQMLRMKSVEKVDYEEPLRKEFQVQMVASEAAQMAEFTALRNQYSYFLNEKDKMLVEFADKFTEYRNKKTEQLRMCEEEIIKLFEYTETVDIILDNIERGAYRVEQKQGKFGKTYTGTGAGLPSRRSSLPGAEGLLAKTGPLGDAFEGSQAGESLRGRVILPRGLRPANPIRQGGSNEMKLSKKIIDKHLLRKGKFEQAQKNLEKKTSKFARNLLSATAPQTESGTGGLDPLVEEHLRNLLGPAGRKVNLFGPKGKKDSIGSQHRPTSAPPIPLSQVLSATRDRFHHQESSRDSSAVFPDSPDARTGRSAGAGRTYSISSVRDQGFSPSSPTPGPISTSPLPRTSDGHLANWAVERKQSLFDRKHSTKGSASSTGSYGGDLAYKEEIMLLKAELSDLKAQMRVDQQLITGVTDHEMIQYIQRLEEENNDLHQKVRDVHAELRAKKVADIHAVHNR